VCVKDELVSEPCDLLALAQQRIVRVCVKDELVSEPCDLLALAQQRIVRVCVHCTALH
jgi:hypothetical protein